MRWPFSRRRAELEELQERRDALARAIVSARRRLRNELEKRSFKAAVPGRLAATWNAPLVHPDALIRSELEVLRGRARQQFENNPLVRRFVQMMQVNLIGPKGLQLQVETNLDGIEADRDVNAALENAWADWARKENCDYEGRKSFHEFEELAISSSVIDGEYFLELVPGAGKYGLQLRMIDAARCPSTFSMDDPTSRVRNGIRYDLEGRVLAYVFREAIPAIGAYSMEYASGQYRAGDFYELPAGRILHGFRNECYAELKRGLPWVGTSLFTLYQLEKFDEAAITNARVGASKMAFYKVRDADEDSMATDKEDGELIQDAIPGHLEKLPPEVEGLETWDPTYPHEQYDPFTARLMMTSSAGLGVNYNLLAQDPKGVNFSSLRQFALDDRAGYQQLHTWIKESLHQRLWAAWVPWAVGMSGEVKLSSGRPVPVRASDLERYLTAARWSPRSWPWVDPAKEVEAHVRSINQRLASRADIIRDQFGRDPEEVWRQLAREEELLARLGIPPVTESSDLLEQDSGGGSE